MIPRLVTEGASFKGAFLYYCHDKKAMTTARVAWTETVNMMTDCVDKAWKVMSFTAKAATQLKRAAGKKRSGDKVEKPVISYSLSWHPEQTPSKEEMLEAARETIKALKLQEHEAFIVAHQDEPQPHVHIVVNRIHPLTGIAANTYRSKRKLQDWARKFQQKEGTDYCPKREENYQKRKKGMSTQYGNPKIIEAWQQSDSGQSFKEALKTKGYDLARGRKRLVVVDPYGKTLNPVRELPEIKAAEFNTRLDDIDQQALPTPEEILHDRTKQAEQAKAKPEAQAEPQLEPQTDKSKDTVDDDFKKRQEVHDERVLKALTQQGEQHHEEWEKAQIDSRNAIETKRAELTAQYQLEGRGDAIDRLQRKLDAPRFLPKFARRIFGIDRKIIEKRDHLLANQEKAKVRFDEAMREAQKIEDKAQQNLVARQAKEQRDLSRNLEKWRPRKKHHLEDGLSQNREQAISIDWRTRGSGLGR